MGSKKDQQKSPPGSDPGGDTNTSTEARTFELVYKEFDAMSPTTRKLITINREVLEADPELLHYMIEKHPDCFKTLPTPVVDADAPTE